MNNHSHHDNNIKYTNQTLMNSQVIMLSCLQSHLQIIRSQRFILTKFLYFSQNRLFSFSTTK